MYSVPSLKAERTTELADVVVANVPRHFIQIGTERDPTMATRVSLPFGKRYDETGPDDDCGLVLELVDARQEAFFAKLEAEAIAQCKAAFATDLPFKELVRDGTVRLKAKFNTDVVDMRGKKIALTSLGPDDKLAVICRCSCLWKSDSHVGASIRVVRILLVEPAVDFVPSFICE